MNKNTVVAFLLIAFTVVFFNSSLWNNFWYGKVLKKPVPTLQTSKQRAAQEAVRTNAADAKDTATVKVIPPGNDTAPMLAASDDDGAAAETDSAAALIIEDTLTVETNRLIVAVSTRGGRIISLKMKDYEYAASVSKKGLVDLLPTGSEGGAQLSINNESFDSVFFTVVKADTGSGAVQTIILEAKSSSGKPVQKEFSFADDTYRIGYIIRGEAVVGRKVTVGWVGGIEDSEASQDIPFGGAIDKRRAHYSDGYSVNHFEMSKRGKEEPTGNFRWVGMSSKYFFVALVADSLRDADIVIEGRNAAKPSQGSPKGKDIDIDYSIYYKADATTSEISDWIYAGPGKVGELSKHGMKFEKTLFPVLSWVRHILWAGLWFPPIAEIILKLLIYFHRLLKDYGVAIFLLTLLSKVVTYPLTQSSNRSMMRMRDLQPKIVALRQKYGKGNQQKFSEEMMALYKAEGINPLNPGCLPMFLQMPIFIALFVVLRKAVELRAATTYLIPWVKDLSQPEALFNLPFSIPFYGTNVALMPILMAALTFFQQKQAIQDPNQKVMLYMMPVIMLVMFNGFPAGVVFYWTLSSALGLVQQKWLLPKPAAAPVVVEHHKAPVKKAGPHHGGGGGKRSAKKR
ncbi:MAG: membrane protein insertase YidC [Chitinispirillales bacterium]|nr:membrane protein insertase YidC [Chitinispirillales bacterium]